MGRMNDMYCIEKRRLLHHQEVGAAMVEAVIVIPFFVVLCAGTLGLFHLWQQRIRLQGEANHAVLQAAMDGNCGKKTLSYVEMEGKGKMDSVDQAHSSMLEDLAGVHPLAVAHSRAVVSGGIEMFDSEKEIKARRQLLCNSKPVDGIVDYVTKLVKEMLP